MVVPNMSFVKTQIHRSKQDRQDFADQRCDHQKSSVETFNYFQKNDIFSSAVIVKLIEQWCEFHQHFKGIFFIRKIFMKLLYTQLVFEFFWAKENQGEKAARKILVKLIYRKFLRERVRERESKGCLNRSFFDEKTLYINATPTYFRNSFLGSN